MGAGGAELSGPWGFVCSLRRGSCSGPRGETGCRRPEQGTPKTSPPRAAGQARGRAVPFAPAPSQGRPAVDRTAGAGEAAGKSGASP